MSQSGALQTSTKITYNADGTCEIKVYYDPNKYEGLPDTILAFIAEQDGAISSKTFKENELIIIVKNFPQNINFTIDNKGNLILFVTTGDGSRYSINDMGELEYLREI